ncbi:MAG: NAD(P) transhydrogenase subunit alpha [Dactylosporangium sp.]|nr:NAD(P) transhydrogenase subunit alpha [Dactylosporangium sp.]NNJ59754.1 NAD(P) transhydrogenase subunit alpha [Dactylosporangium sp.]
MTALTIAVHRQTEPGERRVALLPDGVRRLVTAGLEVLVEAGAGVGAQAGDGAYVAAGATLTDSTGALARADVLTCVTRPSQDVLDRLGPGRALAGLLHPFADPAFAAGLAQQGVTSLSLDGLPRTISRAQVMDALSSQANVAGYKAVLVAANAFGRYFPMLVTAAGTARPAKVLVLGVGVAGLAAIGTAKRLGAVVSAYDIRPESRAEATSVGATFLDLAVGSDGSGEGGYARALAAEEQRAQQAALTAHLARHDVVITTAQVPGRRPPRLVSGEAVAAMAPGSVIVDLAAGPLGGNVDGSRPDETIVTDGGVTIVGAGNLAATVPVAASEAYSRNLTALLLHCIRDGALAIDLSDDIQAGVVITHGGLVVHPSLRDPAPTSQKGTA